MKHATRLADWVRGPSVPRPSSYLVSTRSDQVPIRSSGANGTTDTDSVLLPTAATKKNQVCNAETSAALVNDFGYRPEGGQHPYTLHPTYGNGGCVYCVDCAKMHTSQPPSRHNIAATSGETSSPWVWVLVVRVLRTHKYTHTNTHTHRHTHTHTAK